MYRSDHGSLQKYKLARSHCVRVGHVQVEQYLIKTEDIHEDFRLWITAEPHPNFPIGLLQMGIKITNEAPVGMKAGLRASYQWVSQVSHLHGALVLPDTDRSAMPRCALHVPITVTWKALTSVMSAVVTVA